MNRHLLPTLALVLAAACSSSGSKQTNDDPDNNPANIATNVTPNNVPGDERCGYGGYCANDVACRMCRYEGTDVDAEGAFPAVAFGASLGVAYTTNEDFATVWFASPDAGTAPELVYDGSAVDIEPRSVRIAMAEDDTPWITVWDRMQQIAYIAHRDESGWAVDAVPSRGPAGIAVTDTGEVWIGTYSDGNVLLSKRTETGAWDDLVLDAASGFELEVAVVAHGQAVAAMWLSSDEGMVKFATSDDSLAPPPISASGSFLAGMDLAWNDAGLVATHSGVVLAFDGAEWSEPVYAGSGRNAGLTIGSDGVTRLASAGSDGGVRLAELVGEVSVAQTIAKYCDEDDVVDAVATPDGLVVAFSCYDGVQILRRTGLYPPDYAAKCETLSASLCDAANTCHPDTDPSSADVCLTSDNGRTHCTGSSCASGFLEDICGDASQDPTLVDSCQASAASAECWTNTVETTDNDGGIVLPSDCPEL